MRRSVEAVLLRCFVGESDSFGGRPLHEAIVLEARALGIAGATVLRGALGYGRSSRLHTAKILRLSDDLPLVIEIVDEATRVEALLDAIEPMLDGGLVTLETVRVLRHGAEPPPG